MISPRGVIVPHRNRTRVLGGLLCAFYNGRDARCPCYAAKMAAFPVGGGSPGRLAPPGEAARAPLPRGPRQARPLPWRRSWGDRPTGHAGRVTLPGGRSPYTANRVFLHGGFGFPTRWMCWGHRTVSQLLPVLPISNSNPQLAIGNIGIGNIFTLATFPPPHVEAARCPYGAGLV